MPYNLKPYILFFIALFLWTDAYSREVENLNRRWKYIQGNPFGAEKISIDDSKWENIGIPHSFSIPYFMSKDFYIGYGWYRKEFTINSNDIKKIISLEFDGVFQESEVFVNGKRVGSHMGGYTGYSVDITNAVAVGKNLLAVKVNNLWHADVAPRAGEHTFSGGIYRNVRLVKTSPCYIDWCGCMIDTPDLAATNGKFSKVAASTTITNKTKQPVSLKLITEVLDAEGKLVTQASSNASIEANGKYQYHQKTPSVKNPHLWATDAPYLYTLRSTLFAGKKKIDEIKQKFGFRWMKWTADKGFFLNGKHTILRGANVHQDQAGWGDAVTVSAAVRDIKMMKEAGFNFIRGSHYPHSPQFVAACDSLGMMFWSENVFWGIGGFGEDGYWNSSAYPANATDTLKFEQSLMQQLEEMVSIHRNHPSIIAWSMCNEPFFSNSEDMSKVRRLLKRLVNRCHQIDPTRLVGIGGAQRPLNENRIDLIGDIAGYNGDGATVTIFQDPGIANVVAEYGSVTSERPGEYAPGWGDLKKNDGYKGYDWRSGQSVWCGFDHGSIAGSELGKMGIVDYFRIPKRAWYWYRNQYASIQHPTWTVEGIPYALQLEASKTDDILTDGTDDAWLMVKVLDKDGHELSNSPNVTMRVVSGPGYFPTGKQITFSADSDIRIQDGKAAIAIRSYYAGETVIEVCADDLQKAYITLHFTGAERYVIGVSKEVDNHPYHRYERKTEELHTFGFNNPVFASSEQYGYAAGHVTDDDASKYWMSKATDQAPMITLDTEKTLDIRHVSLLFPYDTNLLNKIQISQNGTTWTEVYRHDGTMVKAIEFELPSDQHYPGRFVRLTYHSNASAVLSKIRVKGKINN